MTSKKGISSTAVTINSGNWQAAQLFVPQVIATDTRGSSTDGRVMVHGRLVTRADGKDQVVVDLDVAAIDRKLAIRQANDRLEGKPPRVGTSWDSIGRR